VAPKAGRTVMLSLFSAGVRNIAVLQGQQLAADIRRLHDKAETIYEGLDQQITGQTDVINGLLEKVAKLNVQIAQAEGGDTSPSDAVGLRVGQLGREVGHLVVECRDLER
jgi:flagellar hook-associated protein FlgK